MNLQSQETENSQYNDKAMEKRTIANAGDNQSQEKHLKDIPKSGAEQVKSSRRQAIKRFTSYAAPAMIALITADEAMAS